MSFDQFSSLLPIGARNIPVRGLAEGLRESRPSIIELRRWSEASKLLDYQAALVNGIVERTLSTGNVRGMICLPTGAGKTITSVTIVLAAMQRSADIKRCLWIAPQRELLFQAATAAQSSWWGGVGPMSLDLLIQSGDSFSTDRSRNQILFVTPIQASKLIQSESIFDMAVFDEAHHVAAPVFRKIWGSVTKQLSCRLGLGLSATPYRGEEYELEQLSESFKGTLFLPKSLMPTPVRALISRGILSTPKFLLIDAPEITRTQWKKRKSLRSLVLEPDRWDYLISFLKTVSKKTIVFCLTRSHGEAVTRNLRFLDCAAEYVDGDTPLTARVGVFERFRDGVTKIVVNVGLFIEGVDCPSAEVAVITYPVSSRNKLAQMIGRVLRGPEIGGTPTATVVAFEGNQSLVDVTLQLSPSQIAFWDKVEQL